MTDLPEQFVDVSEEELRELAMRCTLASTIYFERHGSYLMTLLGRIGMSKVAADELASQMLAADLHAALGLINEDPAHHESTTAIRTAVEAANVAFDAAIQAQLLMNDLEKNCTCHGCTRRRRARAGKEGLN